MFLPPEEVQHLTELSLLVSKRVALPFVIEPNPVRVTERKYIELLDDIWFGERFVGFVSSWLINRDHPSGPIGLPYVNATGCIVGLTAYNRFKDDDATVKIKGLARFRVVKYLDTGKSYPTAQIEFFEEENVGHHDAERVKDFAARADELDELSRRTCIVIQRVMTKIYRALGSQDFEMPLLRPPDPIAFSFAAAGLLGTFDEGDYLHVLQCSCPFLRLEFICEAFEDYEKRVDNNLERKELLKPFQHIKNNPDAG
jgi:hypothetical protein